MRQTKSAKDFHKPFKSSIPHLDPCPGGDFLFIKDFFCPKEPVYFSEI